MAIVSTEQWRSLEKRSATAFLVGGTIFVADTALVATHLVGGTEPGALAQAFVGAAWTAAFVGLLGTYPSLVDRSGWLARAGAVFAAIGAVTMAAMAVTSLGYFTGILSGELSEVVMFFLPGVFVGIVLGFGLFGVAGFRTRSRNLGLLFLLLPTTFLFNLGTGISGFNPVAKILGVVCVLALTMLTIGYLLRTGSPLADSEGVETTSDPTVG